MLSVRVGTGNHDVIFLVVPGLNPEIILGIDMLEVWSAVIDVGNLNMSLSQRGGCEKVQFVTREVGQTSAGPATEDIASELFFVEKVKVYEGDRVSVVNITDPDSYETNIPYSEEGKGLFLYSEEHSFDVEEVEILDELRVMSMQAHNATENVLRGKIDKIEGITCAQKQSFYYTLRKHADMFTDRIGLCTEYTHTFEVAHPEPYSYKCRTVPMAMMKKTDIAIQKLLDNNIIQGSNSDFINALCLVQKTDGTVRVTIDARRLNSMTTQNVYHSEPVQSQINKVNGARWYTLLDLNQAYLQVPLHESCRRFTAFIHRGKQYRFARTPFGLASSGAALARALDKVLGEDMGDYVSLYADDICIFSRDLDQHIKDVGSVLQRLRDAGFTIKPEKIQLARRQVEFLGYVISEDGIRANPTKVGDVLDIPAPRTARQLRRFFGICQFQSKIPCGLRTRGSSFKDLAQEGGAMEMDPGDAGSIYQSQKFVRKVDPTTKA